MVSTMVAMVTPAMQRAMIKTAMLFQPAVDGMTVGKAEFPKAPSRQNPQPAEKENERQSVASHSQHGGNLKQPQPGKKRGPA